MLRCESADWATTLRSGGRYDKTPVAGSAGHDEWVGLMSEQAGPSVAAIQQRQSALADQHATLADADRTLADVLASAHAAMRESVRRLDAIAEAIEHAIVYQSDLALDTPLGVREFQQFLLAKQREIAAVVASAHELARTKAAVLQGLWEQYSGSSG